MKKNKLNIRNIYRPDWLKNKERSKKKLWLDKNENSDLNLNLVIRSVIKKIDLTSIFAYPDLSYLYKRLAKTLNVSSKNNIVIIIASRKLPIIPAYVLLGLNLINFGPFISFPKI